MAERTLPSTRLGDAADAGLDPARSYDVGFRLRDENDNYVGDVEVISSVNGRLPTLRLIVVAENLSTGSVGQKLKPDELRELAGALEKAAAHHELVVAGERRSNGASA